MTIRFLGAMSICLLGLTTSCRHVEDSVIVANFKAAGGGNPDGADVSHISAWFSKHEEIRKQLTDPCKAKQKGALQIGLIPMKEGFALVSHKQISSLNRK